MLRKYTLTGLVAFSIAATPIAAPSVAAKDNVDRLLIGITALAVIGAIANEAKKNKRQTTVDHTPHQPKKRVHHERHRHGDVVHRHKHRTGHHHGRHVEAHDRKHVRKKHRSKKPRECLRQEWTQDGWVRYYSKQCLKRYRNLRKYGH